MPDDDLDKELEQETEDTGFDDIDSPADKSVLFGDSEDKEKEIEPEIAEEDSEPQDDKEEDPSVIKGDDPEKDKVSDQKQRDENIPRGRFDEVYREAKLNKERADQLEAELAALRNPGKAEEKPKEPTIKELRRQYTEAIADLDYEKAEEVGDKIDLLVIEEAERRAEEKMAQREKLWEQKYEETDLNEEAEKLVKIYPELDSTRDDKNQDLIDDVIGWRTVYESRGLRPTEALGKAVEKVMGKRADDEVKPEKTDTRKEEMVKRNVKEAGKQPPKLDGIGARAISTPQMVDSQDDWDKMPAKERKALLM